MGAFLAVLMLMAGIVTVIVTNLAAYATHIMWAFSPEGASNLVLAILGGVLPLIGVIHGWMLWF